MTTEKRPSLELLEAIKQRRAARAFSSDPIPEEILETILHLGTQAPSGFNLQPWRFILVRNSENKAKLKECAFNQRQVEEAPVVLICCGDRAAVSSDNIEAVIRLGEEHQSMNEQYANYMRNTIPGFAENGPSFGTKEVWTNRHTMLAVAQIMLVAKSYGVDSCPMEGYVTAQVKEAFNIPENVDVCCLLPLGYAAEPYKGYGGRFTLDQVCYQETYGNR
ncbi:MAG: nitroreductase family protein [Halothece sp.]